MLIVREKKSLRSDFIWNLIAEGISAGQSALILIFVAGAMTVSDAGVFSIGYALSTIVGVLTVYGVRNFQVSDVKRRFTFGTYFYSRLVTMMISFILLGVYLAVQMRTGNYTSDKAVAVMLICLWKNDSMLEDVFFGMYQQKGYLTLGARIYAVRLMLSTALFCGLTFTGMTLIQILTAVCLFSYLMTFIFLKMSYPLFDEHVKGEDLSGVGKILRECFPLALAGVLGNYIGNAPKYSIDWYMDDRAQAVFGYLIMPSFVILILSNSVYRPVLGRLGSLYMEGDRKAFRTLIRKQVIAVAVMGGAIIAAGFAAGIPVLSLFYSTDLAPYKKEFMFLLAGGIGYALASFGAAVLTAMRRQKAIAVCYVICAILCLLSGKYLISGAGFTGAVIQYDLCNYLLMLLLFVVIVRNTNDATSTPKNN